MGWLLRHDLLDELGLMVCPVLVGRGARLFDADGGQVPADAEAADRQREEN